VIWRSTIVAGYVALAIVIGIAYGGRGVATLSFFYFWPAAWLVFLGAWGWAARAAGRWNFERSDSGPLRRKRNGSRPGEGEAEAAAVEVGVERDSLAAPAPKRRKAVLVLEPPELAP
jgi:hypothetical protein